MPAPRNDLYRLPDGREKMLAHDVRKLATCTICGGLADERTSISYKAAFGYAAADPRACWHPRCCFEHFGADFVLKLPSDEQKKFCMSDADLGTIKRIVDQLSCAQP
jgi:hypothetical protein